MTKEDYLHIYSFIGAAIEVYNILGRGLEESVYQEALGLELSMRDEKYDDQHLINIWYKGIKLEKYFLADFYYHGILVEIKSVDNLIAEHRAQLFNYMRLCKISLGILINFGEKSLRAERYLYDQEKDSFVLLTKFNYLNFISENGSNVSLVE